MSVTAEVSHHLKGAFLHSDTTKVINKMFNQPPLAFSDVQLNTMLARKMVNNSCSDA